MRAPLSLAPILAALAAIAATPALAWLPDGDMATVSDKRLALAGYRIGGLLVGLR